jgi:hypothetical protein
MFSPGTPVSSTNKTDRHDITEVLLKVELNSITLTLYMLLNFSWLFIVKQICKNYLVVIGNNTYNTCKYVNTPIWGKS